MDTYHIHLLVLLPVSLTVPEHPDPAIEPETFLAGVGLFEVKSRTGGLEFDLHVCSIPAGTSEQILVEWLLRRLPEQPVLLGYNLADQALPGLIEAAAAVEPEIALDFISRLTRLVTAGAIDAASGLGGPGAARLDETCRERGIAAEDMAYDRLFTDWAIGTAGCLDQVLATNVVAMWRLWMMTSVDDPDERARADAALSCWLGRRRDGLAQVHRIRA